METVAKIMPLDPAVKAELAAAVEEAQRTGIVQGSKKKSFSPPTRVGV